MVCRGICDRHRAGRPASGPVYDGGRCRCQACGVWLQADAVDPAAGNRCSCCGQRVRFGRRGSRGGMRKLLPAVASTAAEPQAPKITVRPFYGNGRRYAGLNDHALQPDATATLAAADAAAVVVGVVVAPESRMQMPRGTPGGCS